MISYVGECDSSKPCLRCQGDCDDDGGCAGDLECFSRSGFEAVPGCIGEGGMYDVDLGADICISTSPTLLPTPMPSTIPSAKPSIDFIYDYPSTSPSASPTFVPTSSICPIQEFRGRTFYVKGAGACWKIELFDNGNLVRDFSGNSVTCSQESFTFSGIYSHFDSIDVENNVAEYSVGPKGFSGTFQFKQSVSETDISLNVLDWKPEIKYYEVEIVIPSCTLPILEPSSFPTTIPSFSPIAPSCPIQEVDGNVFYLFAQNLCFRVEFYSGGQLVADTSSGITNSSMCSEENFVPSLVFSTFDSFDVVKNVAVFIVGTQGFSGTFQFRQVGTNAVNDASVTILSFNGETKEYVIEVVVPSCPVTKT